MAPPKSSRTTSGTSATGTSSSTSRSARRRCRRSCRGRAGDAARLQTRAAGLLPHRGSRDLVAPGQRVGVSPLGPRPLARRLVRPRRRARARMVTLTERALRVETISSESELAGLAGSWDELVRAMPRPSPFLLHTWLLEWWRHYGDGDELAVHVAYRGDQLVGALPLCTRRRLGLRVSEFVGGTWALLADVLVAPDAERSVRTALVDHAFSGEYDFANLFGLPGSSRLLAELPSEALRLVERLEAPVLDLDAGWDAAYRRKFSSKARSERARRRRQLEALGRIDVAAARTREELAAALEDAFHVYALRWQGRRDASGFVTPTGLRFHRAALTRLADEDVSRVLTI